MTTQSDQQQARYQLRDKALSILHRVETESAYAARLLEAHEHGREPLLRQIVKGTLQWQGRLDQVLAKFLTRDLQTLTPWIRNNLRLSTYQLLYLDRVAPREVVHDAVELAKKHGHPGVARLVNAVLRKVSQHRERLQADSGQAPTSPQEIAESYSHPQWLVESWIEQLGVPETIELCKANNEPAPLSLRVNPLRVSVEELTRRLHQEGIETSASEYLAECLVVTQLPRDVALNELSSFQQGLFQIQDHASALISYLVDPQPGEFVIDLCSAPGGKTTHLAMLMKNQGRLLAVDIHPQRAQLVEDTCHKLGIEIVSALTEDGRTFHPESLADRVLVDAPCSGLGVLRRKPDLRWKKTLQDFTQLSELQLQLLQNAATLVRPGGRLVYSTCTTLPQENEAVVHSFLNEHAEFQIEAPAAPCLKQFVSEKYFFQSWPQRHNLDGMFGVAFNKALK